MKETEELFQWEYEYDLFQNRHMLYLLLRVFGIILAGIFLVLLILLSGNSDFMEKGFTLFLICGLGGIVLILGLICLIYFLVAKAKKGNNLLCYEMTSQQIRRVLTEKQRKRDQTMGRINSVAGIFGTGPNAINAARVGTQLESGSYRVFDFSRMSSVKYLPRYDMIRLRDPDKTFEVYAGKDDYETVKQRITFYSSGAGH